jgi:predicted nucleic acid-binding protein
MRFLMDTNVVSGLRKGARGNTGVRRWFSQTPGDCIYLSVLTMGELRQGVERIRRKDGIAAESLEKWLNSVENQVAGRILPITQAIAERWGRLNVPNPLPVVDGLLAATALDHDSTLVTRNVRDVERSSVRWLNPFSDGPTS